MDLSRILVTGGAGFIGSNFIHHLLAHYPKCRVVNLDKLTYAGNPENLAEVAADPRYEFIHGDICDPNTVERAVQGVDAVVNFAAETHVDRSLLGASAFIQTDVVGTHVLLEAVKRHGVPRLVQIGTDEVYGSTESGSFTEEAPLRPSSPYSASKAAADLLVLSYFVSFGLPVLVTRSSNNYGPRQYPEKLIPLFITNALADQPLPLYGDGLNVRDWIHVDDHARAVLCVLERGAAGAVYNVGAGNPLANVEITRLILRELKKPDTLITYVKDRPGHDRRYEIDSSKLRRELGWAPEVEFARGIVETVRWYVARRDWWEPIKSGAFRRYYEQQYGRR